MVLSKGSYGHGEFKNVLPLSVQIPHLPLWSRKPPRFMRGSIGSSMEICETLALQIPMVPRLHQRHGYINTKLRYEEFKNVFPYSVQIPYLPVHCRKPPRFMGGRIEPRMEICGNSALPIPMILRLRQSNGFIKRKLRAWRVQKCIALVGADTVLTSAGPQTPQFCGG